MRKKTITLISLLFFMSLAAGSFAEDITVTGEPVSVIDVSQEPVAQYIPETLKGFVDESGKKLDITSEDIEVINGFTETTLVIDEPAQSSSFKQRFLQQGSVCYLPIKIIYSSGKTEQTGIFTSLLTGGIATCVLPPADTKIRIGSEYCKLQYSFSSIIKCDPPESVGCCEVAFNLRWFWKTIPVKFCYNSASPILCTVINRWLDCLGLGGSAEWTDGGICNHEIKECVTETPTAAEIASFRATPANGSVTLSWQTGDEADTFGFNIYRAEDAAGVYTKINSTIIYAQAGTGTGADYIYVDSAVSNLDTYYYKLEGVHNDGSSSMSKTAYATPRLIYDIVK